MRIEDIEIIYKTKRIKREYRIGLNDEVFFCCTKCGEWKEANSFSKDARRSSSLKIKNICKSCHNKKNMIWLKNNWHKVAEYNLKKAMKRKPKPGTKREVYLNQINESLFQDLVDKGIIKKLAYGHYEGSIPDSYIELNKQIINNGITRREILKSLTKHQIEVFTKSGKLKKLCHSYYDKKTFEDVIQYIKERT